MSLSIQNVSKLAEKWLIIPLNKQSVICLFGKSTL